MNSVYLVKQIDDEKYKVGVTKDIEQRLRTLQVSNPEKLELITTFESQDWAYKIEAAFKRNYKPKRTLGEWFRLDKNDVTDFLTFCAKKDSDFKYMYEHNEFFRNTIDRGR